MRGFLFGLPGKRLAQALVQLLPAAIDEFPARQRVEFELLDRHYNFHRLAGRWDVVEPAARRDEVLVHLQDAIGEGIAVAKIIEEPAVQLCRAQSRLDFVHALGCLLLRTHQRGKDEAKNKCCEEKTQPLLFHSTMNYRLA